MDDLIEKKIIAEVEGTFLGFHVKLSNRKPYQRITVLMRLQNGEEIECSASRIRFKDSGETMEVKTYGKMERIG